jgi:hypothetical protein
VIRDVAAASGFRHFDPELRQLRIRCEDVGTAAIAFHAKRDHRRMLEQQEQVWNAIGAPLLDERALHRQPFRVRNGAEAANLERPH